ncbi:hypothetical protein Q4544_11475 [Cognatishimia sp. 1_MG-2023]|uniref:ankyrin repeat domain-containing protein n=1 Tax=Cognatishimia sp. 1_MG-2023 TaxID=3062642 RepID=UPI0026E2A2B3|nr:ankyrin repeat domain-containing protein [Cognatishimia sp. 1_MG-2023]MDO6727554.1 hypothetical protein [Cognatishimia sp. 1_MG-2023]
MTFPKQDLSLDALRRSAKLLRRGYEGRSPAAVERLRVHPPRSDGAALRHADFLHVVAQEQNFASWPALKLAAETMGLDRAALVQRLKMAVAHGRLYAIEQLLARVPDLADGVLGLQIALLDRAAVEAAIAADPRAAVRALGPKTPMLHLCFSRWIHARPDLAEDMLAIAALLVKHGADVNDGMPVAPGSDHNLSALYGAIGHADNMVLAEWLLEHGADPNDGESLYHATELGHHRGLELLLSHGADPKRTNALLRAMDFHDHRAVEMLMAASDEAHRFEGAEVGGELPYVIPALHQAARRMSDRRMIEMLLDAGADPNESYEGVQAYGYARVFGNRDLVDALEARGVSTVLSADELILAKAAEGCDQLERVLDTGELPNAYRDLVRVILHLPGKLPHVRRLVELGVEYDRPDSEGLTPVQVAGWEGLPEVLAYFLSLKPDLSHVNGYGGTLLSTIIHGSENCPQRAERDYISCLEMVLREGVALPHRAIDLAGDEDVAAFLGEWAERYPGQVAEGGLG